MDTRDIEDALPLCPGKVSDFAGTEGRPPLVQTNVLPLVIGNLDFRIGVYQISAVRHLKNTNSRSQRDDQTSPPPSKSQPLSANELYPLFLYVHKDELNNSGIRQSTIKSYPCVTSDKTEALKVYVLPAFSPGLMSKGSVRRITLKNHNRSKVVDTIDVEVTYRGNVDFFEQYHDYEELMEVGMIDSIAAIFKNIIFEQIRNDAFIQSQKKEISGVIDILMRMRCQIHTDVLNRPMLSINATFTSGIRINVPLLFIFGALISKVPLMEAAFDIKKLKNFMLGGKSLKSFRIVAKELEIRSLKTRNSRRTEYLRILDISENPGSTYHTNKITMNTFFENAGYPIRLPHMNPVIVKRGSHQLYVPMEHCIVSSTPQKLLYAMSLYPKDSTNTAAVFPKKRLKTIREKGENLSNALKTKQPKSLIKVRVRKPVMTASVLDELTTSFQHDPFVLAIPFVAKKIRYVYINLSRISTPFTEEIQNFVHNLYLNGLNVDWRDMIVEHHLKEQLDANSSLDTLQHFLFFVVHSIIENLAAGHWDYDPHKHSVIFFITIPRGDVCSAEIYHYTKAIITEAGYISQFIKAEIMQKLTCDEVKFNLIAIINAKLGGINDVPTDKKVRWMNFVNTPTMFIGIDTRNSIDLNQRGIVSLAFSTNKMATEYKFFVRRNHIDSRYAISSNDWQNVICEVLNNLNGPLPKRVFVLRSGIIKNNITKEEAASENDEIQTIFRYWFEQANVMVPKFTYIGYTRPHDFYFMPEENSNSQQNRGENDYNVPQGNVINHTMNYPFTFFFVTHKTSAGKMKPAKYFIVNDDNNIDAYDLLSIVHTLCTLSSNSDNPICRPLPIAYCQHLLNHVVSTSPNPFNGDNQIIQIPKSFSNSPPYFV